MFTITKDIESKIAPLCVKNELENTKIPIYAAA